MAEEEKAAEKVKPPRKRKVGRVTVRSADFVKGWRLNPTIKQIAEALGMSEGDVKARGKLYRKKGVKLPDREGETGAGRFDVAYLNTLLED